MNCLNCGNHLSGNYCSNCGQSAKTHRLSIWHFLVHDLVHSFWHVDHGILFTLEEVLVRPGKAAMEYIRGKRAGRFPILTFILILLGISFWLYGKAGTAHHIEAPVISGPKAAQEFVDMIVLIITHYTKWIFLSLLPIGSIGTWIVFRSSRNNYTENLLINSYAFAAAMVVIVYLQLFYLCMPEQQKLLTQLGYLLTITMYVRTYWQAFVVPGQTSAASVWQFCRRIILLVLLNIFFVLTAIVIAVIVIAYPYMNELASQAR